ncbi:MAG: hypothetical protein R3B71_00690 [Candidatus Gracilibacteria bacterium]|nr:hypothetical protein [Candidatus Peregrinibacteria bacterium]
MALKTKKIVIPRKNYQRQIRTYVVVTVVIGVAALIYGFFQFQDLSTARAALEDGQTRLSEMTSFEAQIADQYATLKTAFDQDFENVRNAVDGVLPSEENYTALTKTLDDFVLTLNRQSPSIFMSNLKFSQPRMDADEEYAILPFSMTLSTTRANLERFLQYTENSGSLDDASRLLDVRSITINFPGETGLGQEQELLTVSLSLNAYFQTQQTEEQ